MFVFLLALTSVCGSDTLTSFKAEQDPYYYGFGGQQTMVDSTPQFSEDIDQILQRNCKTLTEIDIHAIALDMNWLRNCYKLKSLRVQVGNLRRGVININADNIKFPELKSFEFFGNNPDNFDSWILDKMPMVEKIKLTTVPAFISVPVLENLVNGLSRLKEIMVELDMIGQTFRGNELNTYCDETEGLTFKYISTDDLPNFIRSYVIEITR